MDYREEILDHFKYPRGKGEIGDLQHITEETNASCGDKLKIGVDLKDGKIKRLVWNGEGCAISQAAMSMLYEKVIGMNGGALEKLGESGVEQMLGGKINPGRKKCVRLGYCGLLNILLGKK